VDGEEFTNEIPDIEASWNADRLTHQMCLIHRDFKHLALSNARQFRVSAQGLVNHVSQGLVNHAGRSAAGDHGLTSLFKPKRKRVR
jgi:hypothetical protein